MWPYMIRLNPVGLIILFSFCITFYLLYSSSAITRDILSDLRKRRQDTPTKETVDLKQLMVTLIRATEIGGKQIVEVLKAHNLKSRVKSKTDQGANELLTEGDIRSHQVMVHQVSATFPGIRIVSEENDGHEMQFFHPFGELQHLLYADDIRPLIITHEPIEDIVVWIDPLDATQEYTENLQQYVTTMACVAVKGVPTIGIIHKPFTSETFWAWKDMGYSENIDELLNASPINKSKNLSLPLTYIISRSHSGQIENILNNHIPKPKIVKAGGSGYKTLELINGTVDAYIHATGIKKWDICSPNAIINSLSGGSMTTLKGYSIDYTDDDVWNREGLLATIRINHSKLLQELERINITSLL